MYAHHGADNDKDQESDAESGGSSSSSDSTSSSSSSSSRRSSDARSNHSCSIPVPVVQSAAAAALPGIQGLTMKVKDATPPSFYLKQFLFQWNKSTAVKKARWVVSCPYHGAESGTYVTRACARQCTLDYNTDAYSEQSLRAMLELKIWACGATSASVTCNFG